MVILDPQELLVKKAIPVPREKKVILVQRVLSDSQVIRVLRVRWGLDLLGLLGRKEKQDLLVNKVIRVQ
jgi:hypothetical protein